MYRSFVIAALLGVASLAGCGDKKKGEGEKESKAALFKAEKPNDLDLAFIPKDAVFVAVVNPQRMLNAPMFANQKKEMAELIGQDNNFDVRQLKQIITYSGAPSMIGLDEGGAPGGAVFRFSSPQDPAQLAEDMFGTVEQQQMEGVATFIGIQGKSALAAVDNQTILVAPPKQLSKMLKAKSATGPLVEKLRTVPSDKDVVGAFVMNDSLRQMASLMIGFATQSPDASPELKEAAKIPANLQSATFLVDFSEKCFLNVAVEMKDEASASALEKLAGKGMEMAKGQLSTESARMFDSAPKEFAAKTERISQQLMNSIEITQEGNLVIGTADMPDDVDDFMVKAVFEARKAAELSKRKNDLKQIGIGLLNYHDVFRNFPPAPGDENVFDENGKPHLSWRVHILPFIEHENLYDQFHLDEPWDSEHNKSLISQIPEVYKSRAKDPTLTTMLMVSGKGLAYEGGAGQKMASFSDGTSNIVFVVDAGADKAVPWTKPVDMTIDPENPLEALGQTQEQGFLALRGDASVSMIPRDISAAELWALFTRGAEDND